MKTSKYKIPKQWFHWCQKANLVSEYEKRGLEALYLKGRGRRWRINCLGEFQSSETYETFDRWANSTFRTYDRIPQTEEEFFSAIDFLEHDSEDYNDAC